MATQSIFLCPLAVHKSQMALANSPTEVSFQKSRQCGTRKGLEQNSADVEQHIECVLDASCVSFTKLYESTHFSGPLCG